MFGDYYRKDVLEHPDGTDHANIRAFMEVGWDGVKFPDGFALSPKSEGGFSCSPTRIERARGTQVSCDVISLSCLKASHPSTVSLSDALFGGVMFTLTLSP